MLVHKIDWSIDKPKSKMYKWKSMCELYKFPASTLDQVAANTSDFRQGRKRHLRDSYAYLANKLPTGNKGTSRDL